MTNCADSEISPKKKRARRRLRTFALSRFLCLFLFGETVKSKLMQYSTSGRSRKRNVNNVTLCPSTNDFHCNQN